MSGAALRQMPVSAPERAIDTGADRTLDPARDFAAVYEAHYQAVFRAVRGVVLDAVTAEDVTQDAFLKAYRARARYRPTGRLEAWLCTIAVREAISRLRREALQKKLLAIGRREAATARQPRALTDRLDELLSVLSPKARAVVVLHFLHGYRYREIASMLRLPEGTVASRLSQAVLRMRAHATRSDETVPGPRWSGRR
jgi:RNA polymerase sigma-70 factor (ECF subfamily)